ncbi:MAG: cation diffusion facilitator family transporter, partial [Methylotenera sp.]|nr:cation diffusion facilitator family transporter [Methylotenera sp.]
QNEKVLWWALGLTTTFLIAEFAAGVLYNSLALISDAAHMFTDSAALAVALAAVRIAKRPADSLRTYGYARFEILAAAFNALLLFAVAIYILFEAYARFKNPAEVQSMAMLWVAIFGLIINLISMKLLSSGKDKSLNMKGAYLEVWSDMLGSIGVIAGAVVIYFTGWAWVDTVVAVAIGLWVLPRTWLLLNESLNLLLEGVPQGIGLNEVKKAILNISNVISVHDLHIWGISSEKYSLTVHVVYPANVSPEVISQNIRNMLETDFSIHHSTIQCEINDCQNEEAYIF